jgi:hypothetical protein
MMDNKYCSITVKLLALIIGIFLAVTLLGCLDPIVADMEAEHQRLSLIAKQELQQGPSNYQSSSHVKVLYPAP